LVRRRPLALLRLLKPLTSLFARYYVLSIKGCKRDDYDYAEVNRLLNIDLKRFIKKVLPPPPHPQPPLPTPSSPSS
jgi:hypothetical protein